MPEWLPSVVGWAFLVSLFNLFIAFLTMFQSVMTVARLDAWEAILAKKNLKKEKKCKPTN